MILQGKFRSDLYYRLNVFPILIPPLRKRQEDIPMLVRHFVYQFARKMGKTIDVISSETLEALTRYSWPGNVRELQNVIERSVVMHERGKLTVKQSWLSGGCFSNESPARISFCRATAGDRETIGAALVESKGRVAGPFGAAALLGIPPSTLESRIRSMNINKYRFKTA